MMVIHIAFLLALLSRGVHSLGNEAADANVLNYDESPSTIDSSNKGSMEDPLFQSCSVYESDGNEEEMVECLICGIVTTYYDEASSDQRHDKEKPDVSSIFENYIRQRKENSVTKARDDLIQQNYQWVQNYDRKKRMGFESNEDDIGPAMVHVPSDQEMEERLKIFLTVPLRHMNAILFVLRSQISTTSDDPAKQQQLIQAQSNITEAKGILQQPLSDIGFKIAINILELTSGILTGYGLKDVTKIIDADLKFLKTLMPLIPRRKKFRKTSAPTKSPV